MTKEVRANIQIAPYPKDLEELVNLTTYRPGWQVTLIDDAARDFAADDPERTKPIGRGLTLQILTKTIDSYEHTNDRYRVAHWFIVPAATYNREAWLRWLFDRFVDVERHEAMEFFQVDGHRPFAPVHAPGHDPYTVVQLTTDEARRTSYRGQVNNGG